VHVAPFSAKSLKYLLNYTQNTTMFPTYRSRTIGISYNVYNYYYYYVSKWLNFCSTVICVK